MNFLGRAFYVQGRGSELIVLQLAMSASHGRVARDGDAFARAYVHAGMVGHDGEKMSKSKGNLVLVSALREQGADPMAIRAALLAHQDRKSTRLNSSHVSTSYAGYYLKNKRIRQ